MATGDDGGEALALLDGEMAASAATVAALGAEMARMREAAALAGREVGTLSSGIAGGLRRAFDGLALDGMRLSDALRGIARSIADTVYAAATRPVIAAGGDALAGVIAGMGEALMPFARGGAFSAGQVMPFAEGGIVSAPVTFPMRGGRGLMGEAGPEAIMPLARGADGRLGVRAQGGGARVVNVTLNVSTPDVQGFQRSQSQIAAQLGRALGRGQRNL